MSSSSASIPDRFDIVLRERGQHSDNGNEPDGVRHAGLSAHDDVMLDSILPLAGRGFNAGLRLTRVRGVPFAS